MATRQSITINKITFNTKTALRKKIREIRDRYKDNERLNQEDFNFMVDLLQRHEDPARKIGCGVAYMYVKTNPVFKKNRGFWLVRSDGSETDFSFEICLKHESKLQKFKSACRTAVSDEIINFRDNFFDTEGWPTCEITGDLISKNDSHVDHTPPMTFDRIVNDFIKETNIDVETIGLLTAEDNRVRNEIENVNLRNRFINYHNTHAVLRVVSRFANLSIIKKGG